MTESVLQEPNKTTLIVTDKHNPECIVYNVCNVM